MRHPAAARRHLPCRYSQAFESRSNAANYARHNDRSATPIECPHCALWHVVRPTAEQIAERVKRAEAERKARVAAYQSTPPTYGKERP